jgi:Domain of unknown function (DUF4440)
MATQLPQEALFAAKADFFRALERMRLQALVDRDIGLAMRLHSVDFQLITPGGGKFSREQYLGKIETGVLRYLRWEPGAMDVRVHPQTALLRYPALLQLDATEGPGTPFRCWHIDSYEVSNGSWQVVWSQATAIRDE